VSQSKFIFVNILWGYNVKEFMRFLPKGLNPFKIQTKFKLDLFLNFIITNLERFGSWAKKEICFIWNYLAPYQVWNFLDPRKIVFCIFKVGVLEDIWKINQKRLNRVSPCEQQNGPALCWLSPAHPSQLSPSRSMRARAGAAHRPQLVPFWPHQRRGHHTLLQGSWTPALCAHAASTLSSWLWLRRDENIFTPQSASHPTECSASPCRAPSPMGRAATPLAGSAAASRGSSSFVCPWASHWFRGLLWTRRRW
jgi:hypothetical protein